MSDEEISSSNMFPDSSARDGISAHGCAFEALSRLQRTFDLMLSALQRTFDILRLRHFQKAYAIPYWLLEV